MIYVMIWKYQYFKYLVILCTVVGFHLFMLNKYDFSFVYCNWFIVFTCIYILVFGFMVFHFYFVIIKFIIFSGSCSLYMHMYVGIIIYLISH